MDKVAELKPVSQAEKTRPDAELPYSLELELKVQDCDTIAELCRFSEGEPREEFALVALRIGILALRQARGQIDVDAVRHEAERMLSSLERQFCKHAADIETQLTGTFKEYFDPLNGRFNERVDRLIKRDGELELLLRAQVGNHDSELCKTLTAHIGDQSPLMRKLSPEQQDGVLKILQRIVEKELTSQSDLILKQFSLDNEDGALARLVQQLSKKHGEVGEDIQNKIEAVTKEFSLNDEQSFFSQLRRSLDTTSQAIHSNLTLDDKKSSLSRLKSEILTILGEHGESNQKFQEDVKTALAQITTRKKEADASTKHGLTFQDAVGEYLQQTAQQRGDAVECTANRKGQIGHRKFGDFVWELGPDSAAPGAKIVVEAKEEQEYTFADARKEIAQARKNRAADIGLFVFSRRTAPAPLETLVRLGNDVFVIWDAEDATASITLVAGIEVARALCLRTHAKSSAEEFEFGAIDAIIVDIEQKADSLGKIKTWADTIQNNAGNIINQAKTVQDDILAQVKNLQRRLTGVKDSLSAQQLP